LKTEKGNGGECDKEDIILAAVSFKYSPIRMSPAWITSSEPAGVQEDQSEVLKRPQMSLSN
jgi:hypothetical protein